MSSLVQMNGWVMLRFGGKNQQRAPRNYLARPEQLRLLVLMASLGLVAVLMAQVKSPAGRQALARMLGEVPVANPQAAEAAVAGLDETRQWMTAEQRETISDNTTFRSTESAAWFAILGELQRSAEPIESLPAVQATYAQLLGQPAAYRGRTVRIEGEIKRVEPQTPAENSQGLTSYYRVIFRPTGKEVWPVAVYAIDPPQGVALNAPVSAPATAVGVFFKNQSYQSQSGAGVMPIVLAKSVTVDAPPPRASYESAPMESDDLLTMTAVAGAIAFVVVLLVMLRGKGK